MKSIKTVVGLVCNANAVERLLLLAATPQSTEPTKW